MNKASRNKYYKAVLENLLEIKGRDQNIFTRVYGTSSFDFLRSFGEENLLSIMRSTEFELTLFENTSSKLINEAKRAKTVESFKEVFSRNLSRLYESQIEQLSRKRKFEKAKLEIIDSLKNKKRDSKTKWMTFIRKCIDSNIIENIWPLHISTLFISMADEKHTVYAPLILREVNLKYENDELKISSLSGWKYNEKLIHYLELMDISFKLPDIEALTGTQAVEALANENDWEIDENIIFGEYQNQVKAQVSEELKFHNGTVLGMYSPEGGNLRAMMKKIIKSKEVTKVIQGDTNVKKREAMIDKIIKEKSDTLYRVQRANYSQDKATISSLIGDTIIWGPPGTGKSQTIANIVANVLESGKSAVVMSQKKAALDVLKDRMGPLAKYVLYILNDNNMDKSHFYKEMADFITNIEGYEPVEKVKGRPLISPYEIQGIQYQDEAKKKDTYKGALKYMKYMHKFKVKENLAQILTLFVSLEKTYVFPETIHGKLQDNVDAIARTNSIVLTGFSKNRKLKSIKSVAAKLALLHEFGIRKDIQKILDTLSHTDVETIKVLLRVHDLLRSDTQEDESDKTISYIENIIAKQFNDRLDKILNNKVMLDKYEAMKKAIDRAHRLPYKFIDDHKDVLKSLFKVVITTAHSSFIEWNKHEYDYVILDESSQMFVETGLPMLHLGKIKVIAGDPQQMKPSNWFSARTEYGDDIAENAPSLLDYAIDKKVYSVMLNKNYRSSAAALMTFSSKHYYESKLDVADNNKPNKEPSIKVVNVAGEWDKSINKAEVDAVIRITKENLNKHKSIIIMTFNQKQRDEIYKRIFKSHPNLLKAINKEQLSLRNVENIQGDEADLVIASVVYDKTTQMGLTYVARDGGMNALNVAVSRAKDQMIVIKSVYWDELKPIKSKDFDMFVAWLRFLDLGIDSKRTYSQLKTIEDVRHSRKLMEIAEILSENVSTRRVTHIETNYKVGTQTIDIAFIGEEKGTYYGGVMLPDLYDNEGVDAYTSYLETVDKRSYLEAKGYPIYTIFEVNWEVNRKKVLQDLGIFLSDNGKDEK